MTKEERIKKMQERQNGEQKFSRNWAYTIPEGIPIYKIKEGENRLDIIPYRITNPENPAVTIHGYNIGDEDYFQHLELHKQIGIGNNEYLCENRMFGKPCPMCVDQKRLWELQDKASAKKLYPQPRAVYNIIDLDEPEKGIQVWNVSYNWIEKKLNELAAMLSKKGEMIVYGDLEVGKTIKFMGMPTKNMINGKEISFLTPENFSFENRTTQYEESIIDKAYPLDQYYNRTTYELIEADYLQVEIQTSDEPATDKYEGEIPVTRPQVVKQGVPEDVPLIAEKETPETFVEDPLPAADPPKRERRRRPNEEKCPHGLIWGTDFDSDDKCLGCADADYGKCGDLFDAIKKI